MGALSVSFLLSLLCFLLFTFYFFAIVFVTEGIDFAIEGVDFTVTHYAFHWPFSFKEGPERTKWHSIIVSTVTHQQQPCACVPFLSSFLPSFLF